MRTLIVAASILTLTACAGYPMDDQHGRAGNYQAAAGLNVVEYDNLVCNEEAGLCGPENLRLIGGKEQDSISIAMWNSSGDKVFEYKAEKVEAFDGQGFRAEVEKALTEQYGDVAKSAVDSIVNAAMKAIAP